MPDTTKIYMDDITDDYVLSCNDCGATVMNGEAKDIKHYDSCTPTPTDDDYFNTGVSDEEEARLCAQDWRTE